MTEQQVEAAARAVWAHVKVGRDPAWEDVVAGDGREDDVSQVREMARSALAAAHSTITTKEELAVLEANTVIKDKHGHVGVIAVGRVRYPETAPLTFAKVAKVFLPATVLHWGTK